MRLATMARFCEVPFTGGTGAQRIGDFDHWRRGDRAARVAAAVLSSREPGAVGPWCPHGGLPLIASDLRQSGFDVVSCNRQVPIAGIQPQGKQHAPHHNHGYAGRRLRSIVRLRSCDGGPKIRPQFRPWNSRLTLDRQHKFGGHALFRSGEPIPDLRLRSADAGRQRLLPASDLAGTSKCVS